MKAPILIAHRGNISGEITGYENSIDYLWNALSLGYDIEVDIRRINNKYYLGHDYPEYEYDISKFPTANTWFHCKDLESLKSIEIDKKYFFHQSDDFTLTSNGYIWTYPGKAISSQSILVLPEKVMRLEDIPKLNPQPYAICSDYVKNILNIYDKIEGK